MSKLAMIINQKISETDPVEVEYEAVSLNDMDPKPLKKFNDRLFNDRLCVFSSHNKKMGTIIDLDNNWQPVHNYQEHKYEMATVLGEDSVNHKLLVYGYKIGERIISSIEGNLYHNYMFYQRGDLVLLRKIEGKNKYSIVHNINQIRLKQKIDEFGEKTK